MNIRKLYLASIKYSDRGKMDSQIATLLDENATLRKENETLKKENEEIQARLKRYINNEAHKKYYENHKDEIKIQQKTYLEKLRSENPEKVKEYWKKANQKRKDKKLQQNNIPELK